VDAVCGICGREVHGLLWLRIGDKWWTVVNMAMKPSHSVNCREFQDKQKNC
jgi:hypothetical protein